MLSNRVVNNATSRLNRNFWWIALGTAVFVLVLSIVWQLCRSQIDPRVAAVRQQGYPISLTELNAFYPEVPADQNLALACQRAFQRMGVRQSLTDWLRKTNAVLVHERHLPPAAKAYLESELSAHEEALDLLHGLPKSERSRYPIDMTQGAATLLPHLGPLRDSVALLVMESMLCADEGQTEAAVEALLTAGRLAETLDREPILISHLVRIAAWQTILAGLEQMLNVSTPGESQIELLAGQLERIEKTEGLKRAVAGERAFGLSYFLDPQQQAQLFGNTTPNANTGGGWMANLAFGVYRASGFLSRDKSFFLASLSSVQAAAEQPFPARFQRGQEASATMPTNRFYLISRMVLPSWAKGFGRDAEHAGRVRTAQAALAVERFRLAHGGALPARLQDLAPQFLTAVPTDPIDGAPLRFKRLETGYVIYSIGPDGKDDSDAAPRPGKSSPPPDVRFEVRR